MKYKKGQVGITRHPELYTHEWPRVFNNVEEELAMWKCAEKCFKHLSKGNFTRKQKMFIIHYVMALDGMSDADMYEEHAFMMFKIMQSVAGQHIREILGNSAKDLAEEVKSKR